VFDGDPIARSLLAERSLAPERILEYNEQAETYL